MFSLFRDKKIVGIKGVWWTMISLAAMLSVKIFLADHLMMHDDEAYYWYWSRYPMWVYPDHGPLLGFFSFFSVFLLGDNAFSLRFMVIILYVLLSLMSYLWAMAAYGRQDKPFAQRLGFILATMLAIIPHYYGLVLIRTDSLMIFFVFLAIGLSHLAIFSFRVKESKDKKSEEKTFFGFVDQQSLFYIMSSCCWGLAFLAKLTTIFLFFGYVLFFFLVPFAHREWKKWSVWVHFVLPFVFCLPMIYCDYLYDFPFSHNFRLRLVQLFRWDRFFEFHLVQWILYFPTYYALFLFLMAKNSWMWLGKMRLFFTKYRFFPAFFQGEEKIHQQKNDDFCVLWQEKVYFLLLSLPAVVYFLQKSFFTELFPNWTIFAAPGVTVLTAFYFAEKWFFSWRRVVFYASNTILMSIILTFPFLLSSKAPTFAKDGTCLYSKYSFLLKDFPKKTQNLDKKALFVGLDYKLPSMVNLYAHPPREAIMLTHVHSKDAKVSSQPYSLWNMIVSRKDLPSANEDFYFLGEISLKNKEKSIQNLEYSLSKTYASFEKLDEFTSYCREKKVARFYLYRVRGYQLFHTLLPRKKSLFSFFQ